MSRKKGFRHSKKTKRKMSLAQNKQQTRACLFCSKKFKVKQSLIKRGWAKFCSRDCKNKNMKGKIPWNKGKNFIHKGSFKVGHIGMVGEDHPNWQGGKSFEKYSSDWTNTLKRSIRERDNYICQKCNKLQSEHVFCVHHIDQNKQNNNPNNLITLCRSCHQKLHNQRI